MDAAQLTHRRPLPGVSLAVTRPAGRALLVAQADAGATPVNWLDQAGCGYELAEDPYAAMATLCRQGNEFSMLVLHLPAMYPEELAIIPAVKKRFAHIEIWLTHYPRQMAMVDDAMRLGADGVLDEEGLHRIGQATAAAPESQPAPPAPTEPLLSVEELKALLGDLPEE